MSAFDPLRTLPDYVRDYDNEQDGGHAEARHHHPLFHEADVSSGELAVFHYGKLPPLKSGFHPLPT
jgi:hypothetical protein